MRLIDDAFQALQNDKEALLRTPILDFFGVEGIGKTAILRQIEQRCRRQRQNCIWIDASKHNPSRHLSRELLHQLQQYNIPLAQQNEHEDPLQQSVDATRALLQRGTAVLLLDSVDASNDEAVRWIETLLSKVIEE